MSEGNFLSDRRHGYLKVRRPLRGDADEDSSRHRNDAFQSSNFQQEATYGDLRMNELDEAIGALQSEAEFEATVAELGASGIDRSRISFLAREEMAASCASAVGCDITQLPRVAIGLGDDRQQVRTLATSLAATVASLAGAGAALAATGGAVAPAVLAALASGGSVGGLTALFGHRYETKVHEWVERQVMNGGIVLIVHPATVEQLNTATEVLRRHCAENVVISTQAFQ
jgi:hypothetical protein